MTELDKLKDSLMKEGFEITKPEAHEKGICINCLEIALPKCYSNAGHKEYRITGLCEPCFDKIATGE